MTRRKPYTKVIKENQVRESNVQGMGDVLLKGFQCLNPKCAEFLFVKNDDLGEVFDIECPKCHFHIKSGEESKFYDYKLVNIHTSQLIESGDFTILHDDYVNEAQEYKFCIICNTIKPGYLFDKHSSRSSKLQGECRLCKAIYNSIKNQSRLTDQHREASQKRRLYIDLSGSSSKINSIEIFKRFSYKCFMCEKDLSDEKYSKERHLDHTLPASYLWPLTTINATLLCKRHNSEKSGKWPSEYYTDPKKLKKLSIITGFRYELISGPPIFNPEAIENLKKASIVDGLLTKYSAYIEEIISLRNKIKYSLNIDFFAASTIISKAHIERADQIYNTSYGRRKT